MEWERLERDMTRRIRLRHLSYETEKAYLGWLARFRAFVDRPPHGLQAGDVEAFLSHLATEVRVSASTQNQAFSALRFLFRHVLHRGFDGVDALRARSRRRLPVVLSRGEAHRVVAHLPERFALMARLIYGAGLRLQECLELRVKDVDVERGRLTVRSGKGDKDRRTVLPQSLHAAWSEHVGSLRALHRQDRDLDLPGVALPLALERKYLNAGTERRPDEYVKYVVARQEGAWEGRTIPVELWDHEGWFGDAGVSYHVAHCLRLLARSVETLPASLGFTEMPCSRGLLAEPAAPRPASWDASMSRHHRPGQPDAADAACGRTRLPGLWSGLDSRTDVLESRPTY